MIRKLILTALVAMGAASAAEAACIPVAGGLLDLNTANISDSGRVWFNCFNDNFVKLSSGALRTELIGKADMVRSIDCASETPPNDTTFCFDETLGTVFVSSSAGPGGYIESGGGGGIGGLPIGSIIAFSGETVPGGFSLADGSALSTNTFSALFNVIGYSFSPATGTPTFNLPDLRGKFIVGRSTTDTDFDTLGETGGAKTHSHTDGGHEHGIGSTGVGVQTGGFVIQSVGSPSQTGFASISTSENIPPYFTVVYLIRTGFEQDDLEGPGAWTSLSSNTIQSNSFLDGVGISSTPSDGVAFAVGAGDSRLTVYKDHNVVAVGAPVPDPSDAAEFNVAGTAEANTFFLEPTDTADGFGFGFTLDSGDMVIVDDEFPQNTIVRIDTPTYRLEIQQPTGVGVVVDTGTTMFKVLEAFTVQKDGNIVVTSSATAGGVSASTASITRVFASTVSAAHVGALTVTASSVSVTNLHSAGSIVVASSFTAGAVSASTGSMSFVFASTASVTRIYTSSVSAVHLAAETVSASTVAASHVVTASSAIINGTQINPFFGVNLSTAASEGQSTTTSVSYNEKLSSTFTAVAGLYRIGWYYQLGNSSKNNRAFAQVGLDSIENIQPEIALYPAENDERKPVSGHVYRQLSGGSHHVVIRWRAAGTTAQIQNARIEVYRVR